MRDQEQVLTEISNFADKYFDAIETARKAVKNIDFSRSEQVSGLIQREYDRLMFQERGLRRQASRLNRPIDNFLQGSLRPDLLRHESEAQHTALAHWCSSPLAAASGNILSLPRKKSLTYTKLLGQASSQ